jgi:hypothetical protein
MFWWFTSAGGDPTGGILDRFNRQLSLCNVCRTNVLPIAIKAVAQAAVSGTPNAVQEKVESA